MAVFLFNELGIKFHLVISVSLSLDITWYNIFWNIVVILTECSLFFNEEFDFYGDINELKSVLYSI